MNRGFLGLRSCARRGRGRRESFRKARFRVRAVRTTEDWYGMVLADAVSTRVSVRLQEWPFGFRLPIGVYDTGIGYIRVPSD